MLKEDTAKIIKPSHVFSTGSLAEMIYDPDQKITAFVIGNGENKSVEEITFEGMAEGDNLIISPLDPHDKLLGLNFVKFPSKIHPYDDVKKLYGYVLSYINKYVFLPKDFAEVAAVYVMFSWLYDRFDTVPYLRVLGGFGSGKTRFLKVIGSLCYKSMFYGGSTTTAAIYRTLDFIRGTMTFDETDFRHSDMSADIIKILNQGHDKNFPVVRMEPKKEGGFTTKVFNVFGPKVFASRERFTDEALESRCVTQRLLYEKDLKVPVIMPEDHEVQANFVRSCLLMFRMSNYKKLDVSEVQLQEIQTARIKQTFMALVSVAKLISDDAVQSVINFARKADKEMLSQLRTSIDVDVLVCLLEIISPNSEYNSAKGIYMRDIAEKYYSRFYDDVNDRAERFGRAEEGGLTVIPNYRISARRIGGIVSRLGISKVRDGKGFFIPPEEYKKIQHLGEHYGITQDMLDLNDDIKPLNFETDKDETEES
ncbi:MAG: hypothetical protein ACP5N7_02430 [Candidatus Pacearchaeota archaeon]